MLKRFLISVIFVTLAGWVLAQDSPPCPTCRAEHRPRPPLQAETPLLYPLCRIAKHIRRASSSAPPMPACQLQTRRHQRQFQPRHPCLQCSSSGTPPAMPALPDHRLNTSGFGPSLPPLPDQGTAPVPPSSTHPASTSPAFHPCRGRARKRLISRNQTLPAPSEAVPGTTTEPKKKGHPRVSWPVLPYNPMSFLAVGYAARIKSSARIAWAAQEVLNSLIFKGYKNLDDQEREVTTARRPINGVRFTLNP